MGPLPDVPDAFFHAAQEGSGYFGQELSRYREDNSEAMLKLPFILAKVL